MNRRDFLAGASAALALSAARLRADTGQTPGAPVFDAMGELRDVYTPQLVGEMLGSGLDAITVTLCDPKTFEQEALRVARAGIDEYDTYLGEHPGLFIKATRAADVDRAQAEGKLAVFYLLQNSTPIGRDLDRVDDLYRRGLRSCQLTYNYQNWAGAGCKERTGAGLTRFGQQLVEKLNDARVLIDLSHASMATMADAIRASRVPVIVSHTGCQAVHEHVRNTTDENLRLLADRGGVVGMCQIRPFVSATREGAFDRYLDHIEHALDVVGADHVGIGSDRDHRVIEMSDDYIAELKAEQGENFVMADWPLFMDELNGPRRMETLRDGLSRRGLASSTIDKVLGANVLRLYREVIGSAP